MEYPTPDVVNCRRCGNMMCSYPDSPSTLCNKCWEIERDQRDAERKRVRQLECENEQLRAKLAADAAGGDDE